MSKGLVIALIGVIVGGQGAARIATDSVRRWLAQNDADYQADGFWARSLLGNVLAFTHINQYAKLRRKRGESTAAATAFRVGVACSVLGAVSLVGLVLAD